MKIKEYRKKATKLTQKDMADTLKLSERQYRRIENGQSSPDIWTAIQIGDALGVVDLRLLWNINHP